MWVAPKTVVNLFNWWKGWKMKKKKMMIWEAIPMAVLWTIWNVRNKLVFENEAPDWVRTTDMIKSRVAFWVKSKEGGAEFSMDDFLYRINSLLESL